MADPVGGSVKYIDFCDGTSQLFDLASDPDELVNRTEDPAYREVRSQLRAELAELPELPELPEPWWSDDPSWTAQARPAAP